MNDDDDTGSHPPPSGAVDRMTKGLEWSETPLEAQEAVPVEGRNIWPPNSWNFHSLHNPSGIVFQRQNSVELENHLAKKKHQPMYP